MASQDMMAYWGRSHSRILHPRRSRQSADACSGYKFETLSLLDKPWDEIPRDVIEARGDHIVNNKAQYCSVVRTGIGKARMIIGGEVDAGGYFRT